MLHTKKQKIIVLNIQFLKEMTFKTAKSYSHQNQTQLVLQKIILFSQRYCVEYLCQIYIRSKTLLHQILSKDRQTHNFDINTVTSYTNILSSETSATPHFPSFSISSLWISYWENGGFWLYSPRLNKRTNNLSTKIPIKWRKK